MHSTVNSCDEIEIEIQVLNIVRPTQRHRENSETILVQPIQRHGEDSRIHSVQLIQRLGDNNVEPIKRLGRVSQVEPIQRHEKSSQINFVQPIQRLGVIFNFFSQDSKWNISMNVSHLQNNNGDHHIPSRLLLYQCRGQNDSQHFRAILAINHNFEAKITFGNRNKNGISVAHWNAGHGSLSNKMDEVCNIMQEYKPLILGISESCHHKSHDVKDVSIDNYEVIFSKTLENPTINASRITVYVSMDLAVNVRNDLMNDSFSSIWLEIGKPRQRKILLCVLYRDWRYMNQPDDSSYAIESQMNRWLSFLEQWERAISSGREVCVLGDINLNFITWMNHLTSHAKKMRPLVNALFDQIIPYGFVQMVTEATRFMSGVEPSGLDHVYTNQPDHLSDVQVRFHGGSDHRLVMVTRYTKSVVRKTRIIKKRSYKNFNPLDFINALKNVSWLEIYLCEDVNSAVKMFNEKMNMILDRLAPIKTIQVRNHYAPWLSSSTKELMKERNIAQHRASVTNF